MIILVQKHDYSCSKTRLLYLDARNLMQKPVFVNAIFKSLKALIAASPYGSGLPLVNAVNGRHHCE